jgi:hypothetical protein
MICHRATERAIHLKEDRDDQDRDDVDDLDHRIDRGAGGVLIRIADGVAGDRRGVGEGAFATKVAFLNVFLGVVPRAAALWTA